MGTEGETGPLGRLIGFAKKLVFVLVGYAISIAILMALRGPIIASSGESTWNVIFGGWVIGTLALLGLLTG